MANSALSRLLVAFEESQGALSIQALADLLGVTQGRVESMIDYWVRKGRIRKSTAWRDCGSCSVSGDCPFVIDLPTTYELVRDGDEMTREIVQTPCQ